MNGISSFPSFPRFLHTTQVVSARILSGGRGDGFHQRFPTLLQRVRIDVWLVVVGLRLLVVEIAALLERRRLFRRPQRTWAALSVHRRASTR